MLVIRKVRKSVSWIMISHLNHLFVTPISENGSTSHSLQKFSSLNIRCFRSSDNAKVEVPELSTQTPISPAVNKISRVARNDGQAVLFEYLHCTRGFNYVDAEHISKNSPCFLQSLLSKVDNDQDVTRALTRYFRYHPINEFEPFFRELGVEAI